MASWPALMRPSMRMGACASGALTSGRPNHRASGHTVHDWRTAVLVEEDQPFGIDGLPGPVRIRTLLTTGIRLTEVAGRDCTELYNLTEDPDEMRNLAGIDLELQAKAQRLLVQELMRVDDDAAEIGRAHV